MNIDYSDGLIPWLREQIDIDEASDWPHRPDCQMLQPVPDGFPFPTFSCNCDGADRWWRDIAVKRTILAQFAQALGQTPPGTHYATGAGRADALLTVAKTIATGCYPTRPNYRPEWAIAMKRLREGERCGSRTTLTCARCG